MTRRIVQMSKPTHTYLAIREACGCVVGSVADTPEWRREVAAGVAEWIRAGYIIERVPMAEVAARWMGEDCPHIERPPRQAALDLG